MEVPILFFALGISARKVGKGLAIREGVRITRYRKWSKVKS